MANIIGQITLNQNRILIVDVDPSTGLGTVAPIGDLALIESGSVLYQKRSAADADWQIVNSKFTTVATGIRTNTPVGININPDATAIFHTLDDAGKDWINEQVGTAGSAFFTFLKALGTIAARTALTAGEKIAGFAGGAYDGTAYKTTCEVSFHVSENQTPTNGGGDLRFLTVENGTTSLLEKARITNSGQLAVGSTAPPASSIVDIQSTTRGFLIPRMTQAQRIAIASPAQSLLVYDTTLNCLCTFSGTAWMFEIELVTANIQTSTANTYAGITELLSQTLDAGLYVLESRGIFQSTATGTGFGLRLAQGTATISNIAINWAFAQGGSGTDKDFEYSQTALADNITSASTPTANADLPFSGQGVFRISAQGTVQFQIRSENAGTGVSIRPNSVFILKKVG